ncbi:MAG: pilus assembly protein TadG-related protein [Nocardioidaceae bacterium]
MRRSSRRTEAGQITAMLVILTICLVIAIAAVTDISASYLRRQAATSLADGAALAATSAAATGAIYGAQDADYVTFDEAAATVAVDRYLRTVGAYRAYPGLSVDVSVVGHDVEVALVMPYRLPVRMPGLDATTTIHASAAAALPIY